MPAVSFADLELIAGKKWKMLDRWPATHLKKQKPLFEPSFWCPTVFLPVAPGLRVGFADVIMDDAIEELS